MNVRQAAAIAVILTTAILAAAGERPAPRFEFDADGSFAFFQVSDIQDRGTLSERPAAVLRSALAAARPQLVVLTGDNVERGANGREDFAKAMEPVVAIFEEFRTPFCVTFGNHDSERKGTNYLSRQAQYDWLKARGGALFVDHDVPELTGVGSGAIELFVPGAAKPSARIFVMDSGDYFGGYAGGYDGCHADQIAWYERVAADGLPHLWFQHIIVPDANDTGLFRPAKDDERGSISLRIHGQRVRAVPAEGVPGSLREPTCPPTWGTYRDKEHTVDGRTLYDAWRANGHMVGAYFGHDHKNTFDAVDENGVRIGMTKALTVQSYNDDDPGLRLFVVHPDGSFETELATEKHPFTVPEDGRPYRPAAPQPVPHVAAPVPEPFPPLASLAPGAPDKGGLFRPGLREELRGFGRYVPGPVQALANRNGTVPAPGMEANGLHSIGEVIPSMINRNPAEAGLWSTFANSWGSGDIYRYRGQVFAAKDGTVRFGERMFDFTTVKLDGKVVFEGRDKETPECSDAIPVAAGWHEIEILFENENFRAGAAWPAYQDKDPPTGPGFGLAKNPDAASTDPADFTFPADPGDGSVFRVPVEGSFVRVLSATKRDDGDIELALAWTNLPSGGIKGSIVLAGPTDGGTTMDEWTVDKGLGNLPAGSGETNLVVQMDGQPVSFLRVKSTICENPFDHRMDGTFIEWSPTIPVK